MKWNDIPSKFGDAFLPFTLLSLGLIAHLNWQLKDISDQRDILDNTIATQYPSLTQGAQVETKVKDLVTDLFQLANSGDPDAQAIIKKYHISQQNHGSPKH